MVGLPLGIVVIVVVILFRRRRPEPRGFDVVRRETPTEPEKACQVTILFDDGKRCRIVGRDEEVELEWFEDYWQRGVLESVGTNLQGSRT
jgi:hypothetical protein